MNQSDSQKQTQHYQYPENADAVKDKGMNEVYQRVRTMCTMVISIAAERFGMKEQPSARAEAGLTRREMKISQLRQELSLLRKPHNQAKQEETSGLHNILRRKLTTSEWHRRRGRERARRRAAFMANPFGVTKKILG
ncbi:hypothetical protein NFI96_001024 [Prochilodus magdalenae]|nr:hypothetical protein NFI96_001024 [Prochilodus magdalenae]